MSIAQTRLWQGFINASWWISGKAERTERWLEKLRWAMYDAEEGEIDEALARMLGDPEVIGNEECPVMYRWTLSTAFGLKVVLHHFMPNGDDPEPHDHPRSFVTLILAGDYVDEATYRDVPLLNPDRTVNARINVIECENMTRGMVRFRKAEHLHRTLVGPRGAWTFMVMGPERRRWGFVWRGEWMHWKQYLAERGEAAIRCPE